MTGQLLGCLENTAFSTFLVALMYVISWDLHAWATIQPQAEHKKNGNIALMTVSTVYKQVSRIALILAW